MEKLVNVFRCRLSRSGGDKVSKSLDGLEAAGQMLLKGPSMQRAAVKGFGERGAFLPLDDIGCTDDDRKDGQGDQGEEGEVGAQGAAQVHVRPWISQA